MLDSFFDSFSVYILKKLLNLKLINLDGKSELLFSYLKLEAITDFGV